MKSELDKKKLIIKFAKKLNSTNLSPLRSGNISKKDWLILNKIIVNKVHG